MCICAAPRTPLEGVTVYGDRAASDYRQLQRFFADRGVLFDHADPEQDQANRQRMVALSGQDKSVVVEIGKKVFVGFNPAELERALP